MNLFIENRWRPPLLNKADLLINSKISCEHQHQNKGQIGKYKFPEPLNPGALNPHEKKLDFFIIIITNYCYFFFQCGDLEHNVGTYKRPKLWLIEAGVSFKCLCINAQLRTAAGTLSNPNVNKCICITTQ